MERKKTIFDYIGQVFLIFGFTVICLSIFCLLFGENAQEISSIFALGRQGIRIDTLLQFLLVAAVIVLLRTLFFTDICIKKLGIGMRTAGMFATVIVVIGICSAVFCWFPVKECLPWVMFLLCFSLCAGASAGIFVLKEKAENRKMQEALERLKKEKQ